MSFKIKPLNKYLLCAGLLGNIPLQAQADADIDTEFRIRKLEQLVTSLRQRLENQQVELDTQQQQINTQQKEIAASGNHSKSTIIAETNGRSLKFKSADGEFSAQLGGRIQADAAVYSNGIPSGNGTDFRRLFLDFRGNAYQDWSYRYQYDFARPSNNPTSSTSDVSRGIRDAYIRYAGLDLGSITVGQFKTPFGLEHLTSSLHSTFLERGLNHLFTPDRRLGLGLDNHYANWTYAVGLFGDAADNGNDNAGQDQDEGWNLIGRLTATPIKTETTLVHAGLSARQHWAQDQDSSLRFRERPEVHVDGSRLIDTGPIANVDEQRSYTLELAAVYGPWSIQAEYTTTELQRDNALEDLDFDGWYVFASYFLTGESRNYKNGIFDRIKVNNPLGGGGSGAWELAVRYSTADLTDGGIIGGELDNATLGINWYATDNIRFAANYISVLDVNRPGHIYQGLDGDIFAARAQIDF